MTEKPNLTNLATDLARANARLLELEMKEAGARNEATAQRNAVNDLQKKIDAAVVELRNAAPRDSDWGQRGKSLGFAG